MKMRRLILFISMVGIVCGGLRATDLPPVPGMDDMDPPAMDDDFSPSTDTIDPPALDEGTGDTDAPSLDDSSNDMPPPTDNMETSSTSDVPPPIDDSGPSSSDDMPPPPIDDMSSPPMNDDGPPSMDDPVDSPSEPSPSPIENSPTPMSSTSSSSSFVPSAEIKEIAAEPLFAKKSEGSTIKSRKEMIADTDEDERQVRAITKRIDDIKSKHLNDYLALDDELDKSYEEVGLARGNAVHDIGNIKHDILHDLVNKQAANASDKGQEEIAKREKLLDALEELVAAQTKKEAAVVTVLKELSDQSVSGFDKASQMYTSRLELRGIIDDSAAQSMHEKIKGTVKEVTDIEQGLTKPEGVVSRLEKVMTDARAHMAKLKEASSQLKTMDVDVAAQAKVTPSIKEEATAAPEQNNSDPAVDVPVDNPDTPHKKKRRLAPSMIDRWTKGTFLEGAYETVTGVVGAVWQGLAPARKVAGGAVSWVAGTVSNSIVGKKKAVAPKKITTAPVEKALDDPVLERIRVERNQSLEKAHGLVEQRRMIQQKEQLLDRLEAERVMQLDRKEDVMAELDRSYARTSRELTWPELGKRFMWKLYASVRRGMKKVIAWWRGEIDPITGRPVRARSRGKAAQETAAQAPETQVLEAQTPEESVQESPAQKTDDAQGEVPSKAELEKQVAAEVAKYSPVAAVSKEDVAQTNAVVDEANAAIAEAEKAAADAAKLLK